LEDDVVAKPNFIHSIKQYIKSRPYPEDWWIIEFSNLGFIGKLFKCEQLPFFVDFFLLFAKDKPIDWLYDIFLDLKFCKNSDSSVNKMFAFLSSSNFEFRFFISKFFLDA
jgi:alpha-1,3-mannosylglycoprotein beta-1,4-N-acetylglucosaminyltransferase A/B